MEELAQIGAVTQQAAEGPQSSSKSQQAVQENLVHEITNNNLQFSVNFSVRTSLVPVAVLLITNRDLSTFSNGAVTHVLRAQDDSIFFTSTQLDREY